MTQYPLHEVFIYDGEIRPVSEFVVSENAGGVYEVIRVAEGVPLFLEEHLDRFRISARIAHIEMGYSRNDIARLLSQLISRNGIGEGNILLSCKNVLKAFFIPHKYPHDDWFTTGVRCGVLHAERENPNAKVFQTAVRQKADALMAAEGYYEVLLVDSQGRITEGSRSNVFFIDGDRLVTPPGKEVLLGITRQMVLMLAAKLAVPVSEQDVFLDDIPSHDAAFITGTSPKILPLSGIGQCSYDPRNAVVQKLKLAYNDLIREYIGNWQVPRKDGS